MTVACLELCFYQGTYFMYYRAVIQSHYAVSSFANCVYFFYTEGHLSLVFIVIVFFQ